MNPLTLSCPNSPGSNPTLAEMGQTHPFGALLTARAAPHLSPSPAAQGSTARSFPGAVTPEHPGPPGRRAAAVALWEPGRAPLRAGLGPGRRSRCPDGILRRTLETEIKPEPPRVSGRSAGSAELGQRPGGAGRTRLPLQHTAQEMQTRGSAEAPGRAAGPWGWAAAARPQPAPQHRPRRGDPAGLSARGTGTGPRKSLMGSSIQRFPQRQVLPIREIQGTKNLVGSGALTRKTARGSATAGPAQPGSGWGC